MPDPPEQTTRWVDSTMAALMLGRSPAQVYRYARQDRWRRYRDQTGKPIRPAIYDYRDVLTTYNRIHRIETT